MNIPFQYVGRHLLDRRGVIKNKYAAPMCCQNEIVVSRVNQNVVNRNVWQIL